MPSSDTLDVARPWLSINTRGGVPRRMRSGSKRAANEAVSPEDIAYGAFLNPPARVSGIMASANVLTGPSAKGSLSGCGKVCVTCSARRAQVRATST